LILDDPIKALDPATAAKCWEQGIKGAMAGKTRVLVVNSQMLPRFASDSAVTRLIIVDKDGDSAAGKIVYNGRPDGMSEELTAKLGDGYQIDTSTEGIAKLKAAETSTDTAAAPEEAPKTESAETGDEATEKPAPKQEEEVVEKPVAKEKEGEKKKEEEEEPEKGSIVGGIVAYCKRMGPWILLSAVGMVATQAAELGLYAWYEHWAKDTFRFGFRKNYIIASEYLSQLSQRGLCFLSGTLSDQCSRCSPCGRRSPVYASLPGADGRRRWCQGREGHPSRPVQEAQRSCYAVRY
jgi:hypothetical protein